MTNHKKHEKISPQKNPMKKLISFLIVAIICFQVPATFASLTETRVEYLVSKKFYQQALRVAEKSSSDEIEGGYLKARIYHQRYLKENEITDFYRAQAEYEKLINNDLYHRKGYEGLIELLLDKPKGLSPNQTMYKSYFTDTDDLYEIKRKYRTGRPYLRYDKLAYKYIDNPYYEIDIIVNKAEKRFYRDHLKYDKKWLSRQYVKLASAILATRPDNPSNDLDRALIFADRAFDLDLSSVEARNLRNTFRQRHN